LKPHDDPISAAMLDRSRSLTLRLRAAVDEAGGWMGFDRYMDLALYTPGLGYYASDSAKFGRAGDFVTAPEISPLFGRCLARPVGEVLAAHPGEVLELGPGTGRLAADLLQALDAQGTLPRRYQMLELSAYLRARQHATLQAAVPHLLDRVQWLDHLPETITGVVLANEVLDAMPVHLVTWLPEGPRERGVVPSGEGFAWQDRPIAGADLRAAVAALHPPPPAPYVSEVALRARALVAALAARLAQGVLLFVDYGFGRAEYYHPQRAAGTLMCHHRHRAHPDPFHLPGLTDITAHVDFTAMAEAAVEAGATLLGYTTQARFLVNCGITALLEAADPGRAAGYLPLAAQAQRLLSPAEMGELFKVLALGRGAPAPLSGFAAGDLSRLL
jgi:SAM-dependent MidA family methyltransferase